MLGLIYKDFRANIKWLCLSSGIIIFYSIVMGMADSSSHDIDFSRMKPIYYLLYASVFIMTGALSLNYVQTDERKKWGYFVTSLPNGIVKQVVSKYIFVALTLAFAFGICWIQNLIVRQFNDEVGSITGILFLLSCITLLIVAVELPCAIAFGTKNGAYIKSGIFVVLVLIAAIYLMFGDISWLGSEDQFTEKFFDKLSRLDLSGTAGKVLLSGIPLYCISCFISTKLYLGGIERMEK